jgi:alkylated DNA repair dioxygenase AlkB
MLAQRDLFDAPILPGLAYRDDIMTLAEESALLRQLETLPVAPFRFQGWLGKRQTASFGWRYDFDRADFSPSTSIPEFLRPLQNAAAAFAGLSADDLVQALVTRYDSGAGIGWHRDRPEFEHVVGISLESPATLRLRRRTAGGFERRSLYLNPRSVYHLSGVARHEWEHGIAEMAVRRWSVTFRSLSSKGGRSKYLAS